MTVRNEYVYKVGMCLKKKIHTLNDKIKCGDFGVSQNLFLHRLTSVSCFKMMDGIVN